MKHIALISTGGTIEKTYDALEGVLHNHFSVLDVMLASLVLEGVKIDRVALMNKDSTEMTDADHALIAQTARVVSMNHDGIVIVHGTDRLPDTGERLVEEFAPAGPGVPIVMTGAMKPYEVRSTDAMQNLTEALMAVQLVCPGVYVAMHNTLLAFPGVVKDYQKGTFVKTSA